MVVGLEKLAVVSEKSRKSSQKCVSPANSLKMLDSEKLAEVYIV